MTTDTAVLLVIAELRQRVAALEGENADLRAALDEHRAPEGRTPPVPMPGVD